ncbi:MAG TPA: M12 family metallo-peptidase, partial [Candidatus Binatia bacterium]|nr:M12 family metallo-peptidase [Candidatus Binatia bacterium]
KGSVYVFGPDGAGAHRSYALRDVAPSALPPASDFCGNDLHPGGAVSRAFAADPHMIVERSTTVTAGSLLEVDMGIETDFELWAKFNTGQGDPTARLLDYVASLVAAGNTVFRELNVEVKIGYVHVYTNGPASDPWSTFSGTQTYVRQNQEVAQKYLNGSVQASGPHDVIHFLSGKKVQGGYSIVGSVCNWDGVSVTQVFGSFDPSNPDRIWDAMAFIHETGHTLGTLHSHCYTPTLDQCFSGEQVHWPDGTVTSCYVGKVVASHGTVMSYCHLLAPGYYNNTALEFGPTITAQIRKTIEPRQCLKVLSTCGDGVVEGDEECDDGNMVGGDGCSADCRLCGNGLLDAGEECDDGNESYDDGCTPSCRLEPCKILPATPGATVSQTAWWGARVAVTSTPTAGDKLNVRGTFALPAGSTIASGQLTLPDGTRVEPEQTGLRLVVESVARRKKLDLFLPPNDPSALPGVRQRWRRSPGSFVRSYTDAAGSVGGIQRVNVFVYPFGPPRVRLSIRGRNGGFGIAPWDVPLHLTVVLGDDATGLAGGCGHYAFAKGSCTSDGRHTRCR